MGFTILLLMKRGIIYAKNGESAVYFMDMMPVKINIQGDLNISCHTLASVVFIR